MKLFEVKASNPIWFGGLKHMTAGEEHYVKSDVLPNIMRFFKIVKPGGGCFGVLLYEGKRQVFLLPSPADIVGRRKKGGNWRVLELSKVDIKVCEKNKPLLPLIRKSLEGFESAEGYFITHKGLGKWEEISKHDGCESRYKELEKEIVKVGDLIKREVKVGLRIDKETRTAEDRMLYFQERIRFSKERDVKLLFLTDKDEVRKEYFIGGERNRAYIKRFEESEHEIFELLDADTEIKKNKHYKLYLLTHTYLENPKEGAGIILRSIKNQKLLKFQLVWIFSKGSELISGYKKPAIKMLKPGTVLVLKANEQGRFEKMCQVVIGDNLSKSTCEEALNGKNFLSSGWNTGILIRGGVKDE